MQSTEMLIQALVFFSTVLGVIFLAQVYGLLPIPIFTFVALGWALFLLDSILTVLRPKLSYYLAFVLALLALVSSLPRSAHYALVTGGSLLAAVTFVLGTAAQVLLVLLVPIHLLRERVVRK